MKIYILSDESWFGGASIANYRIAEAFEEAGHTVEVKTVNQTENTWNEDYTADLYIVANWAYIPKLQLEKLFYNHKVVKFYHDIPGYMYQPKTVKFEQHYNLMQYMNNNALLNVYISPLQADIYNRFIAINKNNTIILPPPKDMNGFEDKKSLKRNGKALYLGDISEARGISDTIQIATQNNWELDLIGPHVDKKLAESLIEQGYKVPGMVGNDKVKSLMNEYSYFIYVPQLIDSFCFKIVEAELCGMEIIADHYRIGRYYYQHTGEELKEMIQNSHYKLVKEVEKRLNDSRE